MKDNKAYIKPQVKVYNIKLVHPIAASATLSFGEGTTDSMDAPAFNDVWWDQ